MSGFRVELFGRLRLALEGVKSDRLDGRKAGALLAYLACYPNRPHAHLSFRRALARRESDDRASESAAGVAGLPPRGRVAP